MAVHPGEVIAQRRAGSLRTDLGSARARAEIPPAAEEFLRHQHMLVVGAPDDDGAVWADVITDQTGSAGLVEVVDDRTIVVAGAPALIGPLLDGDREIGLLGIEPWTRRRMRVNGTVRRRTKPQGLASALPAGRNDRTSDRRDRPSDRKDRPADRLVVRTDQVYSNCPKYIQDRELLGAVPDESAGLPTSDHGVVRTAKDLTPAQIDRIARADTFFVASHVQGHGADVSHRGGDPGVLAVTGSRRLWWPDYTGNSMYMTLGNLELNPACGLLLLDWEDGRTLHLTGRARIDWDERRAATTPGARRTVDFDIDQVIEISGGFPLRWRYSGPSPFNPS